jgi:hypothetical protein
MEIKGKVHCFFEQSGTFKNEFIKLGIPAEDYDIQNNFGQTDHTDDLFKAIEDAYDGKPSLFDDIVGGEDGDLILAFFPCIYFSSLSQMEMSLTSVNVRKKPMSERYAFVLDRSRKRQTFLELLIKLMGVCEIRGYRLIVENPWAMQTYLKNGFIKPPALVDNNRMLRGDYFMKPTAYWFVNCEPTHGMTIQKDKMNTRILDSRGSKEAGVCSEERSMISPDYARNFICDFILGKEQVGSQMSLF